MESAIDPSNITHENMPVVLGVIYTQQLAEARDINEIKAEQKRVRVILNEHGECLQIFHFSRCTLLPWLSRNKYLITALIFACAGVDAGTRYLQWTFFPPGGVP